MTCLASSFFLNSLLPGVRSIIFSEMNHSEHLRFDNQVVIITGAGAGLGKAYAHLFASRGAKVVVNDLGGSASGDGRDNRAADIVVNEIKRKGWYAVADYNSVEDGSKIVQTALDNFGRIDVVVNNAGILRDRSFVRISDADWDLVHRVHLRGSFIVTRAAWPHMKAQKYGRIIMTSSGSGLFGNFGQGNYSAAKMGLVGLSNTLSIEGRKYNINSNTLVPMSGTRLTQGLFTEEMFKGLTPELIAPMVLWLCHKDCEESGGIFGAAGGWFGQYRLERTKGFTCRQTLSEQVSPETVKKSWHKITDFSDSLPVSKDAIERKTWYRMILEELKENEERSSHTRITSPRAKGQLSAVGAQRTSLFSYDSFEVILYALGVGASTKDKDGLKFLYERHKDFSALPTFAILPFLKSSKEGNLISSFLHWKIDTTKLLHGEQYVELVRPIPVASTLSCKKTVVDVLDKGSGALLLMNGELADEQGEVIAKLQISYFIVGDGNFGGPRTSKKQIPLAKPPSRNPDAIETFTTSVDQAALYRLSGDRNPLHISPEFSAMGGFREPILHGLCTYGISARAVLKRFCNNDVTKFKAIMGRFASPVTPGETLETLMWKERNRIHFSTRVKETGKACITGGYVDIEEQAVDSSGTATGALNLKTNEFFKGAAANVGAIPYNGPKMLLLWNILNGSHVGAQWTFDFRAPPGSIYLGTPDDGSSPSASITIGDNDLMDIFNGDINPTDSFLTAKLKMSGNIINLKQIMQYFIPRPRL